MTLAMGWDRVGMTRDGVGNDKVMVMACAPCGGEVEWIKTNILGVGCTKWAGVG